MAEPDTAHPPAHPPALTPALTPMTRAQLLLELQEVVARGKASNTLTPVISALNQIGKFLEDQGGDLPPCGTVEVHFLEPEDPPPDGPKKRRRRKPKPVQL